MKVLDATAVIAFLSEMDCPEGLEKLSKHHELIIPKGVASEIKKQPGRRRLDDLAKRDIIKIINVDQNESNRIQNLHPQLHLGECEVISYVEKYAGTKKICIVSDDSKARKLFQKLNFKWTERLLGIMKEKGIIDPIEYDEKMEKLNQSPFYSRSRNT